jgi:hypothetical protein
MMFRRLMHDEEVLSAVSKHILDTMFPHVRMGFGAQAGGIKVAEMKDIFKYIDKTLFLQLLEQGGKTMTFDQFKTRALERIQKKGEHERYYCLDDLRDILYKELTEAEYQQAEAILTTINGRDNLKDVTLHDSLRPLEDWEANRKCMRSIYNIGPNGRVSTKKRRAPS